MNIYSIEDNCSLKLVKISLVFSNEEYSNLFGLKNNKTLEETIVHKKYQKFASVIQEYYPNFLSQKLGSFLLKLKQDGDRFYLNFLNKYGDLKYCRFALANKSDEQLKGVYFYFEDDRLKYIGRCRDNMKNRINNGYGSVSPKNCYIDGQATNCHLNARISNSSKDITLWIYSMEDNSEIESLEKSLITQYQPQWNIQK